jgi:TPR repeat protein
MVPQGGRYYIQAVKWYRKAAEQGEASAQNNLGSLYVMNWYRKAAEQGYMQAQHNLGGMYLRGHGMAQDHGEAAKWFRKAARQGVAEAQYTLGRMYDKGYGVARNNGKALMLFELAAAQGYDWSAKAIRKHYALRMTPSDFSRAQRLARQCADRNYKDCGF